MPSKKEASIGFLESWPQLSRGRRHSRYRGKRGEERIPQKYLEGKENKKKKIQEGRGSGYGSIHLKEMVLQT